MAKTPNITTITSGYQSTSTINNNFSNTQTAFNNTISRDGSTPNDMQADLDMGNNDIINTNTVYADSLYLNGELVVPTGTEILEVDSNNVPYVPNFTGAVENSVEEKLSEVVSVKDFGAVGDGVADDSAAVQAAVNYLITRTECGLYFPSGRYLFNSRVSVTLPGERKYAVYGDGPSSVLLGNNASGVLRFTSGSRQTQVFVYNLQFKPLLNFSGTAFEYSAPQGGVSTRRMFIMQNVTVSSDVTTNTSLNSFENTFIVTGLNRPGFFNVVVFNNTEPMSPKPNAILNIDGCYGPLLKDCQFNGCATYGISNVRTGLENEGFFMDRCTTNWIDTGVYINQTGRHPDIKIYNSHINAYIKNVHLVDCKFIWLSQNLFYCHKEDTDEFVDVYLDTCYSVYLIDNVYRDSGASNRRHLKVVNGGDQFLIREYGLRATTAAIPFKFEAGVSNVIMHLPSYIATRDFTSYPAQLWESDSTNTNIRVITDVSLSETSSGVTSAPRFQLSKYQATPATGGNLAAFEFTGYTTNKAAQQVYASFRANSEDITDSAQSGSMTFYTYVGGSAVKQAYIKEGISSGNTAPRGTGTVTAEGNNSLAYGVGSSIGIYFGSAAPEGAVTASPGSLYLRSTGLLYVKQTGTGNTGWISK